MADGTPKTFLKTLRPGKILGLEILIAPSALAGSVVIFAVMTVVFATLVGLSPVESVAAGFLAMLLHWLGGFLHHVGHSIAARRTGYPMTGVLVFLVIGRSLYPRDEPELLGSVHVRRALGGPAMSFIVGLMGVVLVLLGPASTSRLLNALAVFFAAENLLVYTLGALLPLGFTDGSSLLRWWGK